MKLLKITTVVSAAFFLCTGFSVGGIGKSEGLTSSKTKKVASLDVKIPYLNTVKYFGYVDKDVKPDGKYKDKDSFYLYVWVPAALDEIGVSMVSPADAKPGKSDFTHPNFADAMKKDPKAYFDTFIVLDRLNVIDPAKIKDGGASLQELAYDDDSSELPKNPGGSAYNSLLRHTSEVGSPTKALVRGLYRITFTSFRGNVAGSYEATIGSNIPGIKVATTLADLDKLVNQ